MSGEMSSGRLAALALAALVAVSACSGGGDGADDDGPDDDDLGDPVTLGASDDALVPDLNPVACQDGFPIQANPSFPQTFIGQGATSCTLTAFSTVQPTALGVIESATIGVGPVTGPMRFVRLRILADAGSTACCSAEELGAEFTPAANGLTTVPLDFFMDRGTDEETGVIFNDWIGIEVLAPDVPVPGIWTANGGPDLTLPVALWLPSLSSRGAAPTLNLRAEGNYSGFLPTFNVVFRPLAAN
jgi:hypothetical protein